MLCSNFYLNVDISKGKSICYKANCLEMSFKEAITLQILILKITIYQGLSRRKNIYSIHVLKRQ